MNNIFRWLGLGWGKEKKKESSGCDHSWKIVAKTYAPAIPKLQTLQFDPTILQKVLFGVTSYMWECEHCGAVHKEELLGSDENQLTEILEKADTLGTIQYVKHEDKSFAITKVPQSQQIPLSNSSVSLR